MWIKKTNGRHDELNPFYSIATVITKFQAEKPVGLNVNKNSHTAGLENLSPLS